MQLREHWRNVDAMVDQVVDVYHVEFNRSLQSYSKIIKLLSESQHHIHSLRKYLLHTENTLSRLQTDGLLQMYHSASVIKEVLLLIEDIQSVSQASGDVERLQADGNIKTAASVLLHAGNKLARAEIRAIPVMNEIVPQLRTKRRGLMSDLVKDLVIDAFRGVRSSHSMGDFMENQGEVSRRRDLSWGSGWMASTRNLSRTLRVQSILNDEFSPQKEKMIHRKTNTMSSLQEEGHMVGPGFHAGTTSAGVTSLISQLGGNAEALLSLRQNAPAKV